MKQILNGSEIVIECLKEQGVDTVFGYPGGAILNIYDELYKHRNEINHILTSHEQGAAHAADGYARATGRVGVCMATSGPGAANLVTGLATAYMDSIPVVAITANVALNLLGKDSFQEIDIKGITMPVTKHNYIVKDIETLADTIRDAFRIARTGRKGPVLVDITKDVTAATTYFESVEPAPIRPICDTIKERQLKEMVECIEQSEKPYILLGGGCVLSDAWEEVREFIDKVDAPVCDTLMGKGVFSGKEDRYTGMIGMHGTKTSNIGVSEADLLIAVGTRFSDRVYGNTETLAKNATIIQIDIDPAEINKNILVDIPIVGDIKAVLTILNKRLTKQDHKEWLRHILDLKEKYPLLCREETLSGSSVVKKIYEMTDGDALITTEVGQNQMWAAQFYQYSRPRQFLTSGGLGTMGYGLGASLGAKMGCPDKVVVNVAGDGCFRMNMNEIATATRSNIPVIEVVINNHVLGMVRQWQTLFYDERYSATTLADKVDFVKVAQAMGARAKRVTTIEEFEETFAEALASNKFYLIDCTVDSDEKVWPMVAPGGSINEAFSEEDLEEMH